MAVSIEFYEDWMKQQVVDLFCMEYGNDSDDFLTFFTKFYEGEFQKDKAIKIVAIDNDKVVGFQSFFYWPYKSQESVYNSFQSGNSLVHPNNRGQGLFRRMLDFAFENQQEIGADFFIGFPVEASFNSFIRNKWENLFNLSWYIKMINVFSVFIVPLKNYDNKLKKVFNLKRIYNRQSSNSFIKLDSGNSFNNWRRSFSSTSKYYFLFKQEEKYVEFEIKFNVRKKIIGELIIGNLNSNSSDKEFILRGFNALHSAARKTNVVTFISIALNEKCKTVFNSVVTKNYKKIDKKIYFIIKTSKDIEGRYSPEKWDVLRGDVDTW